MLAEGGDDGDFGESVMRTLTYGITLVTDKAIHLYNSSRNFDTSSIFHYEH